MAEEFGTISQGRSLSWSETWLKALTQPSEASYAEIANDPGATPQKAYTWILVTSFLGSIIYSFASSIFGTNALLASGEGVFGSGIMAIICGAPIAALLAVLGIMISTVITQAIANALGGAGTYAKLVYAVAAYTAPISLIAYLLNIIPYLNCLSIPVGIYAIVLNITAVKAVNQFSWGKAIASSVVILALLLALVAVIVIVILVVLGPTIGNVFSNIQSGLGTPAP